MEFFQESTNAPMKSIQEIIDTPDTIPGTLEHLLKLLMPYYLVNPKIVVMRDNFGYSAIDVKAYKLFRDKHCRYKIEDNTEVNSPEDTNVITLQEKKGRGEILRMVHNENPGFDDNRRLFNFITDLEKEPSQITNKILADHKYNTTFYIFDGETDGVVHVFDKELLQKKISIVNLDSIRILFLRQKQCDRILKCKVSWKEFSNKYMGLDPKEILANNYPKEFDDACYKGLETVVKRLYSQVGPSSKREGFRLACRGGHKFLVDFFLDNDIDKCFSDNVFTEGVTHSCAGTHLDLIKFFIARGGDTKTAIFATLMSKNTVKVYEIVEFLKEKECFVDPIASLPMAACNGHIAIIVWMMVTMKRVSKVILNLSMSIAINEKNTAIVEYLKQNGAADTNTSKKFMNDFYKRLEKTDAANFVVQ